MPRSFPGDFHHDSAVNSQFFSLCPMCGQKLGPGMVLWYNFAVDTLYLHLRCARILSKLLLEDLSKLLDQEEVALPEPKVIDADP